MAFYEQLLQETENERNALLSVPFLRAGVAGEISVSAYRAFLQQAYHHVKHTVPLLMACGSRLPDRLDWLREAVAEYIEEEIGHEQWILNDIAAAGGNREQAAQSQPSLATELMVAYAYDGVQRRNPVSFFGMVLVLEGTSVNLATRAANALREKHQLPVQAFSYLLSHGELDISHVDFYEKLMNRITDPEDQQAVIHSARVMYRLYGDIFRALPINEEVSDAA